MHLALTLATFVVLTAALISLRLAWPRLSVRVHRRIFYAIATALAIHALSRITGWSTISPRLNATFYWAAVASLEFLIILLTRLHPRFLTIATAVVLFVPLLSSTLFLPLSDIFWSAPSTIVPLADGLIMHRQAFASNSSHYTGVDLNIFHPAPWLPLLVRKRQTVRFLNSQCNSSASSAILEPDHHSVRMICPPWPDAHGQGGTDLVVQLY